MTQCHCVLSQQLPYPRRFFETTGSETAGRRQAGRGDDRSKQAIMCPALDPTTQVKNGNCRWGITLGVPPKGGGGPGCFPLATGFVVVSSWCSQQLPCGLAGRVSCHQRCRFGSSQDTRSPLDPPSLKVASQPAPSYRSYPREFCRWALFGSSQCLGGVIRSRSPDSVLHPTASCTALSRHLTQGRRLAPLAS